MLNGLDLFSGIGGISLALSEWVRPIAYCENDRFAQGVLLSKMRQGQLAQAPIWDDVRKLHGDDFITKPDIIYGGFPCQDISSAGAGRGLAGERSGLYLEFERLISEIKPAFAFFENVPAIRTRGLGRVVWGLAELGYDLRWTIVSAQEVGACHIRKRWFCLAANADRETLWVKQGRRSRESWKTTSLNTSACDIGLAPWTPERGFEPRIFRAGYGLPDAVDRDRALGNSVVPIQARTAFQRLMGLP